MAHACCGPGYASPEVAMKAEREKFSIPSHYTRVRGLKNQITWQL